MLLDATTFELSSRFDEVADVLAGGPLDGRAHPELMQSTLEVASVVCRGVDDLRHDLETVRRGITAAIEPLGMRLAGAGAHPFSRSEDQRITTRDRYRWLVEQLQYVARRELVFGMHVHVAVPDPDLAMHVMESLLAELPVLLALSASSPFWRGDATGLASTRTAIFASMPRSGQPPRFTSYEDYLEMVGTMEEAGAIDDYTYLWWDVRPHPRLGTVEIRVMDAQFDIDQMLMLAAYVQASVARAVDEARRDVAPTGASPPARLREQVGRGALRPRRLAHGPGRKPAHAAARHRAGAPQRRATRSLRARARLRRCPRRARAHHLVGQRVDAHDAGLQRQSRHDRARARLAHAAELRSARPWCEHLHSAHDVGGAREVRELVRAVAALCAHVPGEALARGLEVEPRSVGMPR